MKPVLNTEEARQGKTNQGVRFVLGFGIALVVVAFGIVYATYFV